MVVTIGPELESALNEAARHAGSTLEELALTVLKDRFLPRVELPTPRDEWERRLLAIGTPCGANLSHEDLSSEALYD